MFFKRPIIHDPCAMNCIAEEIALLQLRYYYSPDGSSGKYMGNPWMVGLINKYLNLHRLKASADTVGRVVHVGDLRARDSISRIKHLCAEKAGDSLAVVTNCVMCTNYFERISENPIPPILTKAHFEYLQYATEAFAMVGECHGWLKANVPDSEMDALFEEGEAAAANFQFESTSALLLTGLRARPSELLFG